MTGDFDWKKNLQNQFLMVESCFWDKCNVVVRSTYIHRFKWSHNKGCWRETTIFCLSKQKNSVVRHLCNTYDFFCFNKLPVIELEEHSNWYDISGKKFSCTVLNNLGSHRTTFCYLSSQTAENASRALLDKLKNNIPMLKVERKIILENCIFNSLFGIVRKVCHKKLHFFWHHPCPKKFMKKVKKELKNVISRAARSPIF